MKCLALLLLLLASPAAAQQQLPSTASDRIGAQIGALVIRIETQNDQIAGLTKSLADKSEEIKKLKDKYEPAERPKEKE